MLTVNSQARYSNWGLKNMHFVGKFSREPRVWRERYWDYTSVFENTPKKLILKSISTLKVTTKAVGPFGTMLQKSWNHGKGTKLDHIPLNCRKWATKQVLKQSEHGRALTTEIQKNVHSFRRTMVDS